MTITLADLVSNAARNWPASPAVRCVGDELTWGELDIEVGRTAAGLAELGVAPGDRVGILLHKSQRTPIAVHGALRAGAAYVPLDPTAPDTALASVLDDCGVEVVITDEPADRRLAALLGATRVRAVLGATVSEVRSMPWAERPQPGDRPAVGADDLAYVMYTSGSTGRPKGIMHTHRSAMAYASRAASTYGLGPRDRMGLLTPIHFDMSTFELFAGPIGGACTVVVPEPYLRLPASLAQLIADECLTTLYGVPFLFTQLLDRGALGDRDLTSVRWTLYGGEPFSAARLAEWMRAVPNTRVSNSYGPAEVNQCTYHHVDEPPAPATVVPIGGCWPGGRARVVGDDGSTVDFGRPGELLVSAPTMMAGYWGRPDLTDAATEIDCAARRWYRTGDLVREVELGVFEFVARRDDQVKVRGHRLELSPVEVALASLDGVHHAVAGVVAGLEESSELVAVYVGDAAPDDVVRGVAAMLPSYAVPSRVRPVDTLPAGATGKIDRRRVRRELFPELFALGAEVAS